MKRIKKGYDKTLKSGTIVRNVDGLLEIVRQGRYLYLMAEDCEELGMTEVLEEIPSPAEIVLKALEELERRNAGNHAFTGSSFSQKKKAQILADLLGVKS